jgi:hypothetical protein
MNSCPAPEKGVLVAILSFRVRRAPGSNGMRYQGSCLTLACSELRRSRWGMKYGSEVPGVTLKLRLNSALCLF